MRLNSSTKQSWVSENGCTLVVSEQKDGKPYVQNALQVSKVASLVQFAATSHFHVLTEVHPSFIAAGTTVDRSSHKQVQVP